MIPDCVYILVVICPVIICSCVPVIAIGQTVPVPRSPGPVPTASSVPVTGPVGGQVVPRPRAGPGPGRLSGGFSSYGPVQSRGSRSSTIVD